MDIFRICYRFLRKGARRIPTEASQSIDTILGLKMENEVLKRKLEVSKKQDVSSAQSWADDESDKDYSNDDMDMLAQSLVVYAQGVSPSLIFQIACLYLLYYDMT